MAKEKKISDVNASDAKVDKIGSKPIKEKKSKSKEAAKSLKDNGKLLKVEKKKLKAEKKAAKKAAKETQKLEQKDKKEKKKEKENKKRKAEQVTNGVEDADKEETEAKKQKQDDETDRGDAAGGGTAAKAFQRVKDEEWLNKKGAWDNSYEGTFGSSGWGFKAQQILGKVRGKDFRHEKTKKKRGSYKGGEINSHAICSYKFESDDE